MIDLEAVKARAAAATPGPWFWGGNVDNRELKLVGRRPGGRFGAGEVLEFARWGMQQARPRFANPTRELPVDERDFCGYWMVEAEEFAIYEVCPEATSREDPRVYRGNIIGFRHPDAEFIAHARQDVDDLLAYVQELSTIIDILRAQVVEVPQ